MSELVTIGEPIETTPEMTGLASHVRKVFERNKDFRRKSGVDERLLKCLRMIRREYSPEELANFRERGAPVVYAPVADAKRRAAQAMLGEIFSSPGDRPWSFEPTPVAEVPDRVVIESVMETMSDWLEIVSLTGQVPEPAAVAAYASGKAAEIFRKQQEWARQRAALAEETVHDRMVEGGWIKAFNDYINHICSYGTGVIKGPIPRNRRRMKISENDLGIVRYKIDDRVVLEYEAINPWDCYPSPGSRDIDQGAICLIVRFTPEDLRRHSEMVDWNRGETDGILLNHSEEGFREEGTYGQLRNALEDDSSGTSGEKCVIDGIEFFGEVSGRLLLEIGLTKTNKGGAIDEGKYYEANIITVNNTVIYCRIVPEELGRPLSRGVFYEASDSWWGESPVEKMESVQKVCNASLRDLIVNMAQASGPQTVIKDLSRLHPSTNVQQQPWKVWVFKRDMTGMGGNDNPLYMFNPPSNAQELTRVFDWALKQADSDTGIPAYSYGSNISAGAARTASGLAMLTEAASRGMKMVVNQTDRMVVRSVVQKTYAYEILNGEDESIKGDVQINPGGTMSLILREQASNKLMQMLQVTANPIDMQIIGVKGRAAMLRKKIEELDMNPDDILPTPEKLEELEQLAMLKEQLQIAQQAEGGGQVGGNEDGVSEMPSPPQEGGDASDPRQNPHDVAMRGLGTANPPRGGI